MRFLCESEYVPLCRRMPSFCFQHLNIDFTVVVIFKLSPEPRTNAAGAFSIWFLFLFFLPIHCVRRMCEAIRISWMHHMHCSTSHYSHSHTACIQHILYTVRLRARLGKGTLVRTEGNLCVCVLVNSVRFQIANETNDTMNDEKLQGKSEIVRLLFSAK